MDLDNLKKDWQATNPDVRVDDDKIRQMLDNKGKSAFEKLLKVEKLFLKLLLLCIPFILIFYFVTSPLVGILYAILVVVSFIWQRYKISFLKKINIIEMNLLKVSLAIGRYRKILYFEILVGTLCAIVFLLIYCYSFVKKDYIASAIADSRFFAAYLVYILILLFVSLGVILYAIYSQCYFKNIHEIERSIKEAEEYQKDNIN